MASKRPSSLGGGRAGRGSKRCFSANQLGFSNACSPAQGVSMYGSAYRATNQVKTQAQHTIHRGRTQCTGGAKRGPAPSNQRSHHAERERQRCTLSAYDIKPCKALLPDPAVAAVTASTRDLVRRTELVVVDGLDGAAGRLHSGPRPGGRLAHLQVQGR